MRLTGRPRPPHTTVLPGQPAVAILGEQAGTPHDSPPSSLPGILLGALLGAAMWALLIWAVWALL